ncbi:conserved hypothetical protein [Shewanella halifaxensis HAW-EB4]|uniref:Uncharacterized protein n=1 Tax=Shewanella halifaxensis (strain HAW-EB4) TaxID=458817 RepID=B0TUA7_SHEHH|nr:hypothetical protein [Shewanella halifaxensis]ABZ75407.1 conserved hypothetical protein [Shewanella halifaxensis HAW-EB4]
MLSESVASIFTPYLTLNLSAFDNLKLVVAVLTDRGEECHALETELTVDGKQQTAYLVRWNHHFIYCGRTNSYANQIDEVADLEAITAESIQVLQPPVLSMRQLEFMCMENAHFDHC